MPETQSPIHALHPEINPIHFSHFKNYAEAITTADAIHLILNAIRWNGIL